MKKIIYLASVLMFSAANSFGQINPTFTIPAPSGSPNIALEDFEGCLGTGIVLDDGTSTGTQDASAIWCNSHTIDLSQSFETRFNIRFGNVGAGAADGITFTLQREGLGAIEGTGGYLGVSDNWVSGIDTSVIVEFDIFNNQAQNGDIGQNHVAISYNGNLANPIVPASAITLTNATWHAVRVNWNACDPALTVWLDNQLVATLDANIVNDVFGGNPEDVIFGFTSGSDNDNTRHDVCFVSHTANPCKCEEIAEPTMDFFSPICSAPNMNCCLGADVQTNTVIPGSVIMDWGDGTTSTTNTHIYTNSGGFNVTAYVQYHLLSDPSNCCIKKVQQVAEINCKGGKFEEKGISPSIEERKAHVYPNPMKPGSRLSLNLPEGIEDLSMSIIDLNGAEVVTVSAKSAAQREVQIPLNMAEGVYLLIDANGQFDPIKIHVVK